MPFSISCHDFYDPRHVKGGSTKNLIIRQISRTYRHSGWGTLGSNPQRSATSDGRHMKTWSILVVVLYSPRFYTIQYKYTAQLRLGHMYKLWSKITSSSPSSLISCTRSSYCCCAANNKNLQVWILLKGAPLFSYPHLGSFLFTCTLYYLEVFNEL